MRFIGLFLILLLSLGACSSVQPRPIAPPVIPGCSLGDICLTQKGKASVSIPPAVIKELEREELQDLGSALGLLTILPLLDDATVTEIIDQLIPERFHVTD